MQREQGSEPRHDGERRHDPDGPVIVGVSSQTPGLRQVLEFAADEANRRRVDLTLAHGCSPIPMPTTLEPTTPLKDREVQWIKRLGMMAEMAVELLDPGRTVDIIVDRGSLSSAHPRHRGHRRRTWSSEWTPVLPPRL